MRRRKFLSGTGAVGVGSLLAPGAVSLAAPSAANADDALLAAFDHIFDERLALSPEGATANGFDKGAHASLRFKLDERGPAATAAKERYLRGAIARLAALDASALSPARRNQRELALYYLKRAQKAAPFGLDSAQHPYPISQADGAYFVLPDFLDSRHTITTADDAEAYLARLEAFPKALAQDGERQQALVSRGHVAPVWALEMALGQLRALRRPDGRHSGLAQSLARRAAAKGLAGNWLDRAAALVEGKVYPALDAHIAMVEGLRGQSRAGDGVWRVDRGDEIYAAALAEATTTDLTPEAVHKIGLAQVAELSARLDAVLKAAGMSQGSVGERLSALNQRPDQLYPNTDAGRADLIASLNAGIAAMKARLPAAFAHIPDDPLDIRRVPPEIQDGAPNGYYYRAPFDGSRPAIYWINLRDTGDWPKYGLPDLTYHEGVPGHHLQLSYVRHAGEVPLLLRTMGNSAYTEGWALYAEQLADDLGAFTGLEKAGYLQSLLFRATRLVVDTGLHAKRWSRAQAAQYMQATTGFPMGRAQSEVDRYICMIGQACSYKIGHNTWVRLRAKAQAELGGKFSLPWFHEVLGEGVLPLALLEERVLARIAVAKQG
jgi:uncharacterized protein (DUF885 family)